jgi:AcrR family transcriptional regulator
MSITDGPGGGLRARRRALTERDIEDAALDAFETHGFEHTTMEQIAAHAGVSVRTAFRYFPSKIDTVLFSARHVSTELGAGLHTGVDRALTLGEYEAAITRALSALVESEPSVIERLRRLRVLMLTDARLRAEVAKSEGYLAGIAVDDLSLGEIPLRTRLLREIAAATLRAAFDSWASIGRNGGELVEHYRQAQTERLALLT